MHYGKEDTDWLAQVSVDDDSMTNRLLAMLALSVDSLREELVTFRTELFENLEPISVRVMNDGAPLEVKQTR